MIYIAQHCFTTITSTHLPTKLNRSEVNVFSKINWREKSKFRIEKEAIKHCITRIDTIKTEFISENIMCPRLLRWTIYYKMLWNRSRLWTAKRCLPSEISGLTNDKTNTFRLLLKCNTWGFTWIIVMKGSERNHDAFELVQELQRVYFIRKLEVNQDTIASSPLWCYLDNSKTSLKQ